MTHKQKIAYMDISARIAGFGIKKRDLDLLVSTYELVLQKKGKATISDTVQIKCYIDWRYKEELDFPKNEAKDE